MIETVSKYWELGLATLPTKQDKSPTMPWKGGVKDISKYNAHGIGVVCGQASGNLECLDFDNHFGDAKDNVTAFIEEIRDIYNVHKFPIQSTQSGGFHMLYRCEEIGCNQKLANKPKFNGHKHIPDAIIETRGEGGYFIIDPTPNYRIVRNDINRIPTISKSERTRIIEVAKSFNTWVEMHHLEDEKDGRPGDLYNSDAMAIDDAKGILLKAGWRELSGNKWRRPDKKEGISATFGKVANNVFYVFSSNAYPFEPMKAYTPFQIKALIEYNGDFKVLAKELAQRYEVPKPQPKVKGQEKDKNELDDILMRAVINFKIPVQRPPDAIMIRDVSATQSIERRLFTLGNFSAITGKSKSKKTFLTSMILAAGVKNDQIDNKFVGNMPNSKNRVILFDTEQSNYDAWITANRVNRLIGFEKDNFMAFDLREYNPLERCQIIDYALGKYHNSTGLVVIDGIADLANANNDELEGTRVTSLLMKWTKIFNLHICNVIHQNKNDSFATGHLGSYLMKKSECIISVEKSRTHNNVSDVKCDMIRGVEEFQPFSIAINSEGLPFVCSEAPTNPTNYDNNIVDEIPF